MSDRGRFSQDEYAKIAANFDRMTCAELAAFLGRSEKSVRKVLRRRRLYKRDQRSALRRMVRP